MDAQLQALRASAIRLHRLVEPLGDVELVAPAYPSEWSIADVMSHIGSGAVIMQRRVEDGLAGRDMPDDFAPTVWDEWNAKSPKDKAVDALVTDDALVSRLAGLSEDERAGLAVSMGPLRLDATALVSMRLNEHTLHTWDIEVAKEPAATLPDGEVALIVDNLELIGRFTARPDGGDRQHVVVRTTMPERRFTIEVGPDSVAFTSGTDAVGQDDGAAELEVPAEAFVRLVYGRLDRDHTPAFAGDPAVLDRLRSVFPGP